MKINGKQFSLILFLCLSLGFRAKAEEGMWLPQLIGALNEGDMQRLGMRMSAQDIYNINRSSLKDAIVSFGGFCTGEMISGEGLLLTNHHCGYGAVQSHSSVENDLLTNGFWAMSREEELPNPDLFVTFIVRIEDVTDRVLGGLSPNLSESLLQDSVSARIPGIVKASTKGTHYGAQIKPFFYGNKYFMFVTETFRDVRLVGAPPSSIGKFGGDTDNWVWPRHTGDFSMFRIYAGPDGKPAKYSKDNVPLQPRHFLPINIGGVNPGDFSLVFGFPGRTQEYLTSYAVDPLVNKINPARIAIRDEKLAIMRADMDASDKVRIQYASKYARVANYWKKWIGENRGLKITEAIEKKRRGEEKFTKWVEADAERKRKYGNLLSKIEGVYDLQNPVRLPSEYMREAVYGSELMTLAYRASRVAKEKHGTKSYEKAVASAKSYAKRVFKNYNLPTDKKLFARLMEIYARDIPADIQPELLKQAQAKYKGDLTAWMKKIYKKTALTDLASFEKALEKPSKLAKDPAVVVHNAFREKYESSVLPVLRKTGNELDLLMRTYVSALMEMSPDRKFYPDANSTMRVSYGIIDGAEPEDGVLYTHQTYLEGIVRKNETGNPDFEMPAKLRELYEKKDYGRWAHKGKMPVCFLASNHTTGGNSGSPIIDASGNLIGLNFDRTWQSTMSDVNYDARICRNIGMDARYLLFIIDKYAGATHLINEMKIVSVTYEPSAETEKVAQEEATLD
ncbi:Asp/Glu-specific dipeptidyl-peptidase [Fulvitalea axinellae]|uniref:Dipeptidyl-peptidase n=1 Tax=Fulvitalea axinellae TaxID=1182444 RepID=A0AAU9CK06_9BACT|nr:Asp/Glu-specific dipeptidyl-peptidase [Fulvitalea axinellae]